MGWGEKGIAKETISDHYKRVLNGVVFLLCRQSPASAGSVVNVARRLLRFFDKLLE